MVKGGANKGRKWLSTTKNGNKVFLGAKNGERVKLQLRNKKWTETVSGNRQKWQFIEVVKGWYNIMLTGSMIEKRNDLRLGNAYLSVTKDGKELDLYAKDDGSGRQRWKLKKL